MAQDDDYIPQPKELKVDVAALSEGYRLKKKIKEDSNIVKIGKVDSPLEDLINVAYHTSDVSKSF